MRSRTEAAALIAVAVLIVGFLAWCLLSVALARAHADEPGVGSLVCGQLALGESPSDIAEQLHQGDPRYSIWETTQTVWDDAKDCT